MIKKATAIFADLDETIYPGLTLRDAGNWMYKERYIGKRVLLKMVGWLIERKFGMLNHETAFREGLASFAGWEVTKLEQVADAAYQAAVKPNLRKEVSTFLEEQKKVVGKLVIATESLSFIVRLIAKELDADYIATELEVKDGQITGKVLGLPVEGAAKAEAVRAYAKKHHIDLTGSVALGGRIDDVALLEVVGKPIAFNPNRDMERYAKNKGWEIVRV